MNDTNVNRQLHPKVVITVYRDQSKNNFYLESREVKNVGGKVLLGAAVPMADNIFRNMAVSYAKNNSFEMDFGGYISAHMLYGTNKLGKTMVCWYRPSMKRTLNFSASLGIKGNSVVYVPATFYVIINTKLYVYALMNDERPEWKTKLYNAPFFNIYKDGNVCLGSAQVGKYKAKTFEKEAERFETGFYMAEQNNVHNDRMCKSNPKTLWNRLIKEGSVFPSKNELQQHSKYKTVGELIENLIGNKNGSNYEEDFEDDDIEIE